MKATVQRESLLQACQLAASAVPSRDVNPVLRNFKLIADADRCTLLATDLELSVRLEVCGVSIEEPGEALVPAAKMTSILRETGDEQVSLDADPSACTIRGESCEFELPSDDPEKFPEVPAFPEAAHHEVSAGVLRTLIRRTSFAAGKDSARYAMTGVLCELEDSIVRLVATDGRRMAMAQGPATAQGGHGSKNQQPVIPSKTADIIDRSLSDPGEVIRLCIRPNEILVRTERATLCSRLVEGRFPAYREAFPKKTTVKIPLVVGNLLAKVRQAAIMVDDEGKRVNFTFAKGKLTLQAQGKDVGRSRIEMPLDYDGKPIAIAFNPVYLVEMLKAIDIDSPLTVDLIDEKSAGVFRVGDDFAYLVSPYT